MNSPIAPDSLNLSTPYAARRGRLIERVNCSGGGVIIVPTAPERQRNRDNDHPYRFDSYFYYLTGFDEPESVLVLVAGETPRSILFCRPKNLEREIWDGFRHGPDAARSLLGVDEAYSIEEFDTRLPDLLGDQNAIWHALAQDSAFDERVFTALRAVRAKVRSGVHAPSDIRDVHTLLDEMRLFKDSHEVDILRRSAAINVGAHRRAMRATRPGMFEYEIEAELLHEFRRHGSQSVAYNSIVASGANACVLHYNSNSHQMQAGDLLLIDAGCELDGYASDITRTFPIGGKFTGPQKDIYELVLASQQAAIAACQPNASFSAPHDAVVKILAQGMLDLGLLDGSLDSVLETGSYRRFYMHRTSHWMGLDVHDAGEYKINGLWRPLRPGMVLTIEPGCYIRPADEVPEAFWNIGVRIEDDILITHDGHENLTGGVPTTVADIEALMAEG